MTLVVIRVAGIMAADSKSMQTMKHLTAGYLDVAP